MVVVCPSNPIIQEQEVGRSETQGRSQMYSYSEAILSYMRPPCLKKRTLGGLWRRGRVGRKGKQEVSPTGQEIERGSVGGARTRLHSSAPPTMASSANQR